MNYDYTAASTMTVTCERLFNDGGCQQERRSMRRSRERLFRDTAVFVNLVTGTAVPVLVLDLRTKFSKI